MRSNLSRVAVIVAVLIMVICMNSFAQSESPIRIEFDENSKRIDLITDIELPDYRYARRGSFQFFIEKLDSPDEFINYMFATMERVYTKDLVSMMKFQPQLAIWLIVWKSGRGLHPLYAVRIHHLAVSFISLTTNGETERRVYLLLDDLKLIEWGNEDQ